MGPRGREVVNREGAGVAGVRPFPFLSVSGDNDRLDVRLCLASRLRSEFTAHRPAREARLQPRGRFSQRFQPRLSKS